MTFLNPLALLAALLAVPIVLLYMLRLRRREVVVSSHFLWQRVLRDYAANTPWQRLRRSLLLLLQLLILALLVLALARPAVALPGGLSGRVVVLLDASASMQTIEADGQTRWETALRAAQTLVDQIGVGDEMLLLRVADVVDVLSDATADRARLSAALEGAQPSEAAADWETAFTLAAAAAGTRPDARIVILTDGSAGDLARVALPPGVVQPRVVLIGRETHNIALSTLAIREVRDGQREMFALVANDSDQTADLSLALRLDGVLWRSEAASIAPRAQRSFIFTIAQPFQTVQATLVLEGGRDGLALDNVAYAAAPLPRVQRVLLVSASGNDFLRRALDVMPGIQVVQGDASRDVLPTDEYDAYVLEGWLPDALPDADLLIVHPPRSTRLFLRGDALTRPRGLRVEAPAHPLLRFVDFSALNVRQLTRMQAESLHPLVTLGDEPLLLAGERGSQQIVVLPFDLADTDLPLQIAFPILLANALEWFTPRDQLVAEPLLAAGSTLRLTPPLNADRMTLRLPGGETITRAPQQRTLTLHESGLYHLQALAQGAVIASQWVAVNMPPQESLIAPVEARITGGRAPDAQHDQEASLRDLSPWLAGLALLLLLLEWAVYHRQMRRRASAG